jgi:hypothetical protein
MPRSAMVACPVRRFGMRRFIGLLVLVTLLVGLVAAAGCGKKEKDSVTTPEGTVKYNTETKKIEVTKDGETTTWNVNTLSEKALGVPVPDNAELQKGSAAIISGSDVDQKWSGATFWSDEALDTVTAWYKEELSGMTGFQDASTEQDGVKIGLFTVRTGDSAKSVIVGAGQSGDPGKTKIVIATAAGEGITGTP